MSQNYTHFFSKKIITKYTPFVRQFWSDQVILLDSFKLSGPLVTQGSLLVLNNSYISKSSNPQ